MGDLEESRRLLEARQENLAYRNKKAREQRRKYAKMSYVQILKEPENKWRLERAERQHKQAFEAVITKHAKHLWPKRKDIFADFMMEWLAERVYSVYDYLYEKKQGEAGQIIDKNTLKNEFINK